MPYIRVRPKQLKKSSDVIKTVQREVQEIDERFYQTGNKLHWKVKSSDEVDNRIRKIKLELDEEANELKRMYEFLLQAAQQYSELEQRFQGGSGNGSNGAKSKNTILEVVENTSLKDSYSKLSERIKNIFTLISKTEDVKKAGLSANVIGYVNSLIKVYDKTEYGDVTIANLIKTSAKVWKSYYSVKKAGLKDKHLQKLLEMKFGTIADCVGIGGDFAGWLGTLIKAVRTESYEDIEKFSGASADLLESVYLFGETSLKTNAVAHIWTSIAKSVLATGGKAGETLREYLEDGKLSLGELASMGVKSSVHGLNELVSSLSYKVLSTDNLFDKSSDQIAEEMESWAQNWGNRAGNYILNHPELKQEYDGANGWNRTRILVYAIFKAK